MNREPGPWIRGLPRNGYIRSWRTPAPVIGPRKDQTRGQVIERTLVAMEDSFVRNDEVVGSIPTSSTNLFNHLPSFAAVFEHRKSRLIGP